LPLPHSFRALGSRNFRLYFTGQAVSMIGTWIQSIAVMWLAYRLSGSTWFTGLIGFLNSAPYLFVAPFAGVFGDRGSRRKILMTVLALLAVQSLALTILAATRLITLWQLAALAAFAGICNAVETPTRQAFFVQLLDRREDLPTAIALNSVLMNGTRLLGPSLGGLLIAAVAEWICFGLNAVSYLAVLIALFRVEIRQPQAARAPSHPLADLAAGWRYAMGFLPFRRMLFQLALISISIAPYVTLMPAMAVKTFHEGPELVGLFVGAVGLGAVTSAVFLARRPGVAGLVKWIAIAAIVAGLGAIGFSYSRWIPLSVVFMMMAGFGMFMTGACCNTILQTVVDDEKRGRVMSYYTMAFMGMAPLGSLLAGLFFAAQMPTFRAHLRPVYVTRGIIPASSDRPK
jgi:MFS family permease